jgi:hypothetical protein
MVEDGTDTDITWDKDNCVESFRPRGNKQFAYIQELFRHMVFTGEMTFTVGFGDDYTSRQYSAFHISVFRDADFLTYRTGEGVGVCDGGGHTKTLGQVFAHELIHHAPVRFGQPMNRSEEDAMVYGDNAYNAGRGRPLRCSHEDWG